MSDGFNALKTFLIKLHIYKSIADIDNATNLYSHYDAVDDESLKIREIYLNDKIPKKIFIQPTLILLKNGTIEYKSYNDTTEDMIQSFIDKKIENLNSL
jgi:dipeptidyl-peptidase-3